MEITQKSIKHNQDMKNIHVLPTDKPSTICKIDNVLVLSKIGTLTNGTKSLILQNIYITSDEEIKEGDYVYSTAQDYNMQKVSKGLEKSYNDVEHYKKIILTTDQDLIKDGVQAIDDEFLEWFVKNPSCEEVEVEKLEGRYVDYSGNVHSPINYKIIIPKEEPKQETLLGKTISKKDGDKDSFEDVTNYKIERSYSEEDMLKSFMAGIKFEEDTLESFMTGIKRESNNEQNFEQFIKQINYENKK